MRKQVLKGKKTLTNDLIDEVSDRVQTKGSEIHEIPLDKIKIKGNVRTEYKEEEIKEMAESIKQKGLLQPITVVKTEDNFFEIIFGHRRFKGLLELRKRKPESYFKISCIVKSSKDFNPEEITEIQLIENIQRENLSASELKQGLEALKKRGYTNKQIAEKLGKSEGYVKNIFSSIKSINKNEELKKLVESNAGVTLADLQEIKVLSSKNQIELLKEKLSGKIKNREELRQRVWEVKSSASKDQHTRYKQRKNFDILQVKDDGTVKSKSFSYNPDRLEPTEKEKLIKIFYEHIERLKSAAAKEAGNDRNE